MDEKIRAEAEAIWNIFKPATQALADKITAYYHALGTTRQCRQINELWHPENAGIGIGFVPPEALERLETLIVQSGLHLHKANGPLGKAMYFSLLNDTQLTPERMGLLGEFVEKETLATSEASPTPKSSPATLEAMAEEQLARVEGLTSARGEKLRTRPAEVGEVVDAFNGAIMNMTVPQTIEFLEKAIAYFNLPDITRRELLRTMEMIHDAETNAAG